VLLNVQAVESNPGGFLQEAILTEASEEAQQAYIDAQSRARDVTMLVRCVEARAARPVAAASPRVPSPRPYLYYPLLLMLLLAVQVAERGRGHVQRPRDTRESAERDAGQH